MTDPDLATGPCVKFEIRSTKFETNPKSEIQMSETDRPRFDLAAKASPAFSVLVI
jgi:hypothetical protein